ncbi:Dos2-interacting transcription regulator of RNA-Pol-II-domain-containing protein [Neohortaea acidophila]|uniref:MMS19 nucleotide excision repair protein n=1 Tax=Neohortaea acidophila TaxID=245834 RepID=A0A6A6PLE1_9PEZI|nr:Dos2-interacting transcription regulator of RNA-Pol-II-domain-containing protein [Neohortaea acidophila]KAF2480474.1 Dos2-interacting transcription regulator of RNA-Pol-II-domain-containing protein [Neohortaea acidophila]
MSDIQLYLLEVDKDKQEAKNIAVQSGVKLRNRQLKLIDLITSLQEYINDKDDAAIRAKSVAYLADVLENVPSKVLSGQERRLLSDFILGRIEGDLEGIGHSARALIALEAQGKWDAETAKTVARTFVDYANPLKQFKLQTDRYATIQLFDILLSKYRTPLKELHDADPEFMAAFVALFEGEKDPRNLMLVFSILQVPMTEWDIHAHAQDLFDAVFNYFPVTFKPPPDDPYGITAQDLKDRLRDCIAATSDFAAFSIPALLDKLDSSSMNTKRDVLQAIQACVVGYTPNTINQYSVPLWDALKFEILNVQENDLAEASLQALALIAAKFAENEGRLNTFLGTIIKECNEHLEDAPTKQSQAAGLILHAVAGSAPTVADKIAKGVLPKLFTLHNSSESLAKRRGLLEIFNEIAKAYVGLTLAAPSTNIDTFQESAAEALQATLRAVQRAPKSEVSLRLTAVEGLAFLLAIPRLLTQDQTYQVVDAMTDVILHETIQGHGDIRPQSIQALGEMAHTCPAAIRDRAIPAFMAELPDAPDGNYAFSPVLEAFAQLSAEQQVFDTVVRRLKNKLGAAKHQNASASYQRALLLATLYAFTYGTPVRDEDGVIKSSYYTEYAEPLIRDLHEAASVTPNMQDTAEIVGRICNIILRPQGVHFQNTIHNQHMFWTAPTEGHADMAAPYLESIAPLSLYYYAALRPEVVEPTEILSLLKTLTSEATNEKSDGPRLHLILRHLSLLINKYINPKTLQPTLEAAGIKLDTLLSSPTATPTSTSLAFTTLKALLIQGRSPALTTTYLQALLALLSDPTASIAQRFPALLAEDDILIKENHCLVSGLYKQRTFNQTVPLLIAAVQQASSDPQIKQNHLIALSGILKWLPYSMLQPSLSALVPPLLQTLDLPAPDAKAPALTIFESVLMHEPSLVAEHTASLITRLLNSTTTTAATNTTPGQTSVTAANVASVRAKALQCLTLVPRQLKRETVVPYRRQVVKKLMFCLDDGKREVRAEAVRCRKAWLGLDEEEEDDD